MKLERKIEFMQTAITVLDKMFWFFVGVTFTCVTLLLLHESGWIK